MSRNHFFVFSLVLVLLLLSSLAYAVDDYKPYLHKAAVPEHPKIRLFGQYHTNLFPGAATYSVPIEVPKGINNLQPGLSFSYNSESIKQRAGILGAGWSLIQDYIYRDINSTPNNVSDDRFILLLEGNTYELVWGLDGFYHTEVEYNFKVQNFSSYWLLIKKDGTKYRFGYNDDSSLGPNQGQNYLLRWNLDRMEDTHGNNISYFYVKDPFLEDIGAMYLSQIRYNQDQSRKIVFNYENFTRPDRRRVWEQGNLLEESRRLTGISVFVEKALVRRYALNYTSLGAALSSLSKLSVYGADNVSVLYNLSFDYYLATEGYAKDLVKSVSPVLFSNDSHEDFGVRLVDINNDGYADLIQGRDSTSEKKVWLNDKNNNWTLSSSWTLPEYIVTGVGVDEGVRLEEVNKDGFVDFLVSKAGVRGVYLNNHSGWASSSWTIPIDFVDGNGIDQGVVLADVNGDGKADLVKGNSGTREVYLNNGSGWNLSSWTLPVDFINLGDTGARLVDINGDGLPDILQSKNSVRTTWLNNGTGWVNDSSWAPPVDFVTASSLDNGIRFVDVNSDGLVDLQEDFANGTSTNRGAWLNTGQGWQSADSWKSPEPFTKDGYNIGRRLADVNGDGFADVIVAHQNSSTIYSWTKNFTLPYLLRKVTNEYGGITLINYTASTQYNNSESGYSEMGFNLFVVNNVTTDNGLNSSFGVVSSFFYNYSYGKYNYNKSEFRGFGLATERKPSSLVRHYFYQDDPRRGKEYQTEIYSLNDSLYSKTVKDYYVVKDNKVYNLSLKSSADYSYDGLSVPKITNKSYDYDFYGNLLSLHDFGDVNVSGDEREYNYSYALNRNYWIMDRLAQSTVYDASGTKVKESKNYYDGLGLEGVSAKGELSKIEQRNSQGNNSFTYFTYDSFGNVVRQTDSLGNTQKYNYDTFHTYPTSVVNALGQVTYYNYNLSTGNLNYVEKNSVRTSYYYDTFGRVVSEVQPLDTVSLPTKKYNYSLDGKKIDTWLKTTANNTNHVVYFYDGFGNLVQLKSNAEGQQIVKNLFYDGLGRITAEQNPYFAEVSDDLSEVSGSVGYTNYTYDALDRVTAVRNPDGTSKNITFEQYNITDYDENGNKHTYTLDALGRITNVTEYNINDVDAAETYITSYEYDGNDNLVKITDALGNEFKFGYDSLGRKVSMSDPDMGNWTYVYDQNGNLLFQSGGGGNLVTGDGYYREYNGEGQLIIVRNGSNSTSPLIEEYWYDQDGQRIKIWRNDSANTTIYTPFKEFMQIRNSSGTFDYLYVYQDGVLVARKNPDGTIQYVHTDHLGSTSVITNSTGDILESTLYEPYGEESSGGALDVKGYTGQFDDELTEQMYYGARYYLPSQGQLINPDLTLPSVYDPQQLNRYAYARDNPYAFSDKEGNRITYQIENYYGNDIIAIYRDSAYLGKVTSETETKTTYPSVFENWPDVTVTNYDYTVQPAYRTIGSNGGYDYINAPGPEQMLSDIVAQDKDRLLRDENLGYIGAMFGEATTILGMNGFLSAKRLGQFLSLQTAGYAVINKNYKEAIGAIPLPGSSLLSYHLTKDWGYQSYQKIPEFKGFSKSESITLAKGGSVRKGGSIYTTVSYNGKTRGVKLTPIQ